MPREIPDELVERLALERFAEQYDRRASRQVIEEHWRQSSDGVRSAFYARARAVLSAVSGAGWEIVAPGELTEATTDDFAAMGFVPRAERDEARAQAEALQRRIDEAARLLAAALTGHERAEDAPHLFRRGEVADLEMALYALREGAQGCAQAEALREEGRKFADWIERDRREPDKVLCVVQSMRRAFRESQEAE